jgi:hypothetical protein
MANYNGNLYGFRYVFSKAGDRLLKYRDTSELTHNIIVLAGSVAVNAEGEASKTVQPGYPCNFAEDRDQYITALEDDTVILNLLLLGVSEDSKDFRRPIFREVFWPRTSMAVADTIQ